MNLDHQDHMISEKSRQLFSSRTAALVALLLSVSAVVTLIISRSKIIASLSVDLAHHYSLIKEFHDFGGRSEYRSYLDDMNYYPALSHAIIAFIAKFTGSIMQSISLTAITCTTIIYIGLFLLIKRDNIWKSIVTSLLLFIVLRKFERWQLTLGHEIIDNFFLAQLFGEALFMILALAIYRFTKPLSFPRLWSVFLASWILCYVHLLPGLRIFIVFFIMLTFDAIPLFIRGAGARWQSPGKSAVVQGAAYAIFAGLLTRFHPAYHAMKIIALNKGALDFGISLNAITALLVFSSLIILPILAYRIFRCRDDRGTFDRLSLAMGIGGIALLLAQLISFQFFNAGSLYAVKKHLLFVFTINAVLFILCIARILDVDVVSDKLNSRGVKPAMYFAVALIFAVLSVHRFYPRQSSFDLPRLVRLQSVVGTFPADKTVLPMDSSLPDVLNYLVAIGDRRMPRDKLTYDLLAGKKDDILIDAIHGNYKIDYIVTNAPLQFGDVMPLLSTAQFITYSATRYWPVTQENLYRTLSVGQLIQFNESSVAWSMLIHGWSQIESWGVWSDSEKSSLAFRVDPTLISRELALKLHIIPWITTERPSQSLTFLINNIVVMKRDLISEEDLSLPLHLYKEDVVKLDIMIKDPVSPQQLGLSTDNRKLGIALISMELQLL